MFRPYELFVGLRYLRAKRHNRFISVISFFSVAGITVGVMALITVLSVMNGFQHELRERILSMTSHVTISGFDGKLAEWHRVIQVAGKVPHVIGAAPYVEGQAMLTNGSNMSGALIRGVAPAIEPMVDDVEHKMVVGSLGNLVPGGYGIVLGKDLAYALNVGMGDKVVMLISEGSVTPAGLIPRYRRFTVVGVFNAGVYQYDRNLAMINIKDARTLFGLGKSVTGVRLRLDNLYFAPQVSRELVHRLNGSYYVNDWTQQNANLWKAIATEKTVMFIILSLIVLVAAFNIVITLVMTVTDKQADIAILRTLGATPRSIMVIFIIQGIIIGLTGTLLGLVFGILLATHVESIMTFLQHLFHTQFLPADVYYISDLPSEMHTGDVIRITLSAFILTILSTLYPAWHAARTQPAEALRYE